MKVAALLSVAGPVRKSAQHRNNKARRNHGSRARYAEILVLTQNALEIFGAESRDNKK
jgi:hypothetical protein